jgi:predicted site-specific integrase-resolvase
VRSQEILELAQRFSVSSSTIYQHLKNGWTPDQPLKVRNRKYRLKPSDVNGALLRWKP